MTTESNTASISKTPLDLPSTIWFLLFAACGVASSFLCDALWDGIAVTAFLAIGMLVIGLSRHLRPRDGNTTNLLSAAAIVVCRGLLLGSLLLGCSMLSWFLAEVLTRGRSGVVTLWFSRLVLAVFLGSLMFLLLKRQTGRSWEYARRILAWTLGIGVVFGFAGFLSYFGPADLSKYPPPIDSPYRLPWKPGIRRLCIQGNRTIISHWRALEYSYDFVMPVGTEICASRGGRIVEVVDHNDGNGPSAPGNHVVVFHEDRTFGVYAHVRQNGAMVIVGQIVAQGDVIALSGNVGISTLPHVHFHVIGGGATIPFTFADVPGDGVPRMFRRYQSVE